MKVNVINQQKDLKIDLWQVKRAVKALLQFKNIFCDEISIYFVEEKKICSLHEQYFNDSSLTDCITFPLKHVPSSGLYYLGDSFICPKTAIQYCLKNLNPVFEELTLYLVHSLLHLLGLNDITKKEQKQMRAEEKIMMDFLLSKNLLLR